MRATLRRPHRRSGGLATIELALVLPLLLLLVMGVIDLSRGLQADLVLTNISREAANLSERNTQPLSAVSQTVMDAVAASAPPLDMNHSGMIYITKVMGVTSGSTTRSVVIEQYRWDDTVNNLGYHVSLYAPASKIWSCTSWSATGGACNNIPATTLAPTSSFMNGQLADGEVVYVVETFYQFSMFFGGFSIGSVQMPTIGPDLYSMTVF